MASHSDEHGAHPHVWVRTATALIGFGFTLFQFFERSNPMPGVAPPRSPGTIRIVALGMIGIGTAALIVAILLRTAAG